METDVKGRPCRASLLLLFASAGVAHYLAVAFEDLLGRTVLWLALQVLRLLAAIFFLFSLQLVEESFIDFVLTWWPTLLILSGVLLVLSYGLSKKP